ncbi:MAG: DUF3788 domain-containing protein [Bacteroidetes bacterium]|nr:DUF3788 domain-containing protein [Bacteroidota bacterium]MBU1799048.1 DUF3788 domain-containing protein [Bacteroidota bacterium]
MIFSHIGSTKKQWNSIYDYIYIEYSQFSELWRYYIDGKGCLLKVTKKTKTIFWLSIIPNSFRIAFYFGDKAEQAIMESTIS